jgi:hypothetical protein
MLSGEDNRSIRVTGTAGMKKHERKTADWCASISTYQMGGVVGDTGPTVFLLQGETRRSGYTDGFLHKFGCDLGSTIMMTENAFMMVDVWEKMTPHVINIGMCAVRDTTCEWWMNSCIA